MAVFYNKEKAKLGSLSGMIISFPVEVVNDNPSAAINKELLPAGYLRCDGRVLFAEEYPILAEVLGTGGNSKYKQESTILSNNQFQLPDLRNKHIRATTSSNIGQMNDLTVEDAEGNTILKSGVGLDVIQNVESPLQLTYTGEFYVPPQEMPLRGEPAFSVSSGAYTEIVDVPARAFQPHMHRSTTTRARQRAKNNADFSAFASNYARHPSSLNVCQWWENTEQILCYWAMTSIQLTGRDAGTFFTGPSSYCYNYGACFNDVCSGFIGAEGLCLWPSEGLCPEVDNKDWCITKTGDSNNHHEGKECDGETFGNNIFYPSTYIQRCVCTLAIFGECLGGANGKGINEDNSDELTNWPPPSYSGELTPYENLPFTTFDDENYQTGLVGVSNITTTTGEVGSDGTHRHRLDFNSDEPHTYTLKTRAATMRPEGGIVSRITIKASTSRKADRYIQPYVITEYLIKI
tara:strand:+ start:6703 stop:8088 length:1386 start_codon:yes stop_codon:yes gene_type:complete